MKKDNIKMKTYRYDWTSNGTVDFIKKLTGIDASGDLTNEEADIIYEAVGERICIDGFDKNDELTEIGYMCESIIDDMTKNFKG